jgi:hypothetical protein
MAAKNASFLKCFRSLPMIDILQHIIVYGSIAVYIIAIQGAPEQTK